MTLRLIACRLLLRKSIATNPRSSLERAETWRWGEKPQTARLGMKLDSVGLPDVDLDRFGARYRR